MFTVDVKQQINNNNSVFVRCVCVVRPSVRPSEFVRAITYTFLLGFQNNLAQLFSLRDSVNGSTC